MKGARERSEGILVELQEVYEEVVGALVREHGSMFEDPVEKWRRGDKMGNDEMPHVHFDSRAHSHSSDADFQ